jgi:hypothetical protein
VSVEGYLTTRWFEETSRMDKMEKKNRSGRLAKIMFSIRLKTWRDAVEENLQVGF